MSSPIAAQSQAGEAALTEPCAVHVRSGQVDGTYPLYIDLPARERLSKHRADGLALVGQDPQRAMFHACHYVLTARTLEDPLAIADAQRLVAGQLWYAGRTELGVAWIDRSIAAYAALGDFEKLGIAWNMRGVIHQDGARYAQAVSDYTKALDFAERAQSDKDRAMVLGNLGALHGEIDDYARGLDYTQRAYETQIAMGEDFDAAATQIYAGTILVQAGDPTQALTYFRDSLAALAEAQDTGNMTESQHALLAMMRFRNHKGRAEALIALDRRAEALDSLNTALDLTEIAGAEDESVAVRANRAIALIALGRYDAAQADIDRAMGNADPDNADVMEVLSQARADVAAARGDFETAYAAQGEVVRYAEARRQSEVDKALANALVQSDIQALTEKIALADTRMAEAETTIGWQRGILAASLIGIALMLGLVWAFFQIARTRSRAARDLAAKNAEIATTLSQRDLLLADIHHRTKNNLQILSSLFNMDAMRYATGYDQGQGYVAAGNRAQAMALLHDHMHNQAAGTEIDAKSFLERLVGLLDESLGRDGVIVCCDADAIRLDVAEMSPIGLLVCELISNAYKHAFAGGGGRIDVTLRRHGDSATLTVTDDGTGFDTTPAARREDAMGIRLAEDLAEQLGSALEVVSTSEGTIWTVRDIAIAPGPVQGTEPTDGSSSFAYGMKYHQTT